MDITLNMPVKSINYENDSIIVTAIDGSTFEADKVIVTVPLGVLKSNSIQFSHPFPLKRLPQFNV
jgi:monoamine oxidase